MLIPRNRECGFRFIGQVPAAVSKTSGHFPAATIDTIMKLKAFRNLVCSFPLIISLLFVFVGRVSAAVHTWTGAANGSWSNPANWSNGAPSNIEPPPIQVIFPQIQAPAFLNTTNDLSLVDGNQMIIQGSGYTFFATGNATNYNLSNNNYISVSGANNVFSPSLNLSFDGTNVTIYTAPGVTFTIQGVMQGNNGFTKTGMGEMVMTGSLPNWYFGSTYVQAGTLTLNKDDGVTAVPGTLLIGTNVATNTALVKVLADGQIGDLAQFNIYDNGTLDLNGHDASSGWVILNGGVINTGNGTLTLGGSLDVNFSALGNSSISGKLSLGSFTRNFNISSGILDLSATISSGAGIRSPGITKYGAGLLTLSGANTFTGPLTIGQGTVEISSNAALGSTNNGVVVTNNATLRLVGVSILDEPLSLSGSGIGGFSSAALQFDKTNVWGGPVTLAADAFLGGINGSAKLSMAGVIDGSGGLILTNNGILVLNGSDANTYGGTTQVAKGKLQLNKSFFGFGVISVPGALIIGQASGTAGADVVELLSNHQIANAAQVTVRHTGLFDLNGNSDTVGHVVLEDGQVSTSGGVLTMNGNIMAPISGTFFNSLSGKIALNGNRAVTVGAGATLQLMAELTDGGIASDLNFNGAGTVNLSASNSFSGSVFVNQGRVSIGHTNALGTTNAGTFVGTGELVVGSMVNVNEPLTLSGFGSGQGGLLFSGTNIWNGPVTFAMNAGVAPLQTPAQMTFSGLLNGSGNVVLTNGGTFIFAGNQANNLTGTTELAGNATLRLAKVSGGVGTNAVGSLLIGNTTTNKDSVILLANNQLAPSANITGYKSGSLDVQNFSTSANNVMLSNAVIKGTTGVFSISGSLSGMGQAAIQPKIRLEPGTAISVNNGALSISGEIADGSGPAGFTKSGDGFLNLSASNSFSGAVVVDTGMVVVKNPSSLGTTNADTTISSGASLGLAGVSGLMENITLSGLGAPSEATITLNSISTNLLLGKITLATDITIDVADTNEAIHMNGVIDGPGGFKKLGAGLLSFGGNGNNSYAGKTVVKDGVLELTKTNAVAIPGNIVLTNGVYSGSTLRLLRDNQIVDAASVASDTLGALDLNGFSEIVGSVVGTGTIKLGNGTLTTGGDNTSTTFSGLITGTGSPLQAQLVKTGTGTFTLKANNTYSGDTMILGGKLIVDGVQSGPVDVLSPAVLGGNGTVGKVTSTSGVISPGASPGKLTTGNLACNSTSSLLIELNGTAATNYDQLSVVGTVNLNGALTPVVNFNSGLSNQFVIIQNDGNDAISGTFSGLPEGGTLNVGNRQFKISYVGGDGNDVVLTQVTSSTPPVFNSVTRLANGTCVLLGSGSASVQYTIEASTNLTTWDFLMNVSADNNGNFQINDAGAQQFTRRFYRGYGP